MLNHPTAHIECKFAEVKEKVDRCTGKHIKYFYLKIFFDLLELKWCFIFRVRLIMKEIPHIADKKITHKFF